MMEVWTATITHHYDDSESWAEVFVGKTKENVEATALAGFQKYVDEYFDCSVYDVNPCANASTLADLVRWFNEESSSSWVEREIQAHELP